MLGSSKKIMIGFKEMFSFQVADEKAYIVCFENIELAPSLLENLITQNREVHAYVFLGPTSRAFWLLEKEFEELTDKGPMGSC